MSRKEKLLQRLAGRTDHLGRPKPGYAENVAAIRAELALLEENMHKGADDASQNVG